MSKTHNPDGTLKQKSNTDSFTELWVMDIKAYLNHKLTRAERVPMANASLSGIAQALKQGPLDAHPDMDEIKLAIFKTREATLHVEGPTPLTIEWKISQIPFAKKFYEKFG